LLENRMAEPKTYQGGCHCGRVRFQASCDLVQVLNCNCSICSKRAALWAFVPAPQFTLLQGQDALADYQFGKKIIHPLFCRSCGIGAFSRGTGPNGAETYAVNVRCLDGVEVSALTLTPFDGRSL
jgi:hypothetical protein